MRKLVRFAACGHRAWLAPAATTTALLSIGSRPSSWSFRSPRPTERSRR